MSKVFISYVREDAATAERLYSDLTDIGADPWMDTHDLIGGQGWQGAIKQAVHRSRHFVALISRNSVRKRGPAQREIRAALEMLDEIPPDEIYLIPVRIDDAVPSYEQLQALEYVDLFPSYVDGFAALRKALAGTAGLDSPSPDASSGESRDAGRMRSYRQLFDRAAFQMPCIFEFALIEVQNATQDIAAAMATGKAYSRDGRLLMEVPPKTEFETVVFQSTLDAIQSSLAVLRQTVADLERLLITAAGMSQEAFRREFHHMEFFLLDLTQDQHSGTGVVSKALELMDRVDTERNTILKCLNVLLEKSQLRALTFITLSTEQVKLSAELEENNGEGGQRWDDFYLRTHRALSAFVDSTDDSK